VKIFEFDRDVVGRGPFDARAGGPARRRIRTLAAKAGRSGNAMNRGTCANEDAVTEQVGTYLGLAISQTGGAKYQNPLGDEIAQTSARRAKPVQFLLGFRDNGIRGATLVKLPRKPDA
jgi:hypothetical protein